MRIMISGDGIAERFGGMLEAAPSAIERAEIEGLNEGGDLTRTQVRRALKAQTGVKQAGTVTSRTRSYRAHGGLKEYRITGEGSGLPIKFFPVSARTGGPVVAQPWAVRHQFERSFRTSRQGLLRARRGDDRMPIRALYGPSIAKEIVKDDSAEAFEAGAPVVEGVIFKRLGRLLP